MRRTNIYVAYFVFQMPEIELNLGNSKVKFEDIVAKGLSRLTINIIIAIITLITAINLITTITITIS